MANHEGHKNDWTLPVVFILIGCIALYFLFLTPEAREQQKLLDENTKLLASLEEDPDGRVIAEGDVLSALRIQELHALSDDELRQHFGVEKDFCVTFEDEAGTLFPLKVGDDCYTFSVGIRSVRVKVGDATVPCGYRFNSKLESC